MALVLVASDLPSLRRSIRATLEGPELEVLEAETGPQAVRVAVDEEVDLAILDLQIGAMGAIAICAELRNLESYGDAAHTTVLLLLDRRPDVFLARRAGAEGFCVKPLEPAKLRRAVRALLDGAGFEDDAWRPMTVGAPGSPTDG
ncbi:MAG TPA: response regulator [Acidimicrobiales bacterium]|jgi:DNA-binding response OmpR family regulator|nr:response regulator [Acidimicrobiales bacterium]